MTENTSTFLFSNDSEKYFLAVDGKAIGPLSAQEIYAKIVKGEASLMNYIWREGYSDWLRIANEQEFEVLVPKKPSSKTIEQIRLKVSQKKKQKKEAALQAAAEKQVVSPEAKAFYVYFNRTQYGPFSKEELVHVLKSHRLDRTAYLWTPGWSNWKRMCEIEEYANYFEPAPPVQESKPASKNSSPSKASKSASKSKSISVSKKLEDFEPTMGVRVSSDAGEDASEKRRAPRRPLVARLFLHNDQDVIIAVCRDISVGGMQVLTDRAPGPVGTKIKLNVSPSDTRNVKGFVAEGEIVRVLEDGRGFSFRFTKISEETRKAIASYIKSDA